jgi:hypothetical protein
MFGGDLVHFGIFVKMLVAPERKRLASSALHTSKENNFLSDLDGEKIKNVFDIFFFSEF